MMSWRRAIVTPMLARRCFSDKPPKKFKNFAEISQATNQPAAESAPSPPPRVETQPEKPAPAPAAAAPKVTPKSPERASPVAASTATNRAAGEDYLVPEYFQHNEYSFYDLNTDMLKGRLAQPRAERRD